MIIIIQLYNVRFSTYSDIKKTPAAQRFAFDQEGVFFMIEQYSSNKEEGSLYTFTYSYKYETSTNKEHNAKFPGMSEQDWKLEVEKRLTDAVNSGHIEFMAFVYHDKDVEKGKPVQLHVHVFTKMKQSHHRDNVKNAFGIYSKALVVSDPHGLSKYLTHISDSALNAEKHIYGFDTVRCFNCKYQDLVKSKFWNKDKKLVSGLKNIEKVADAKLIAADLGKKISDGVISRAEAEAAFKDEAGYYWFRELGDTFEFDEDNLIRRVVKVRVKAGRDIKHVYIMGNGGIGKTSLAYILMQLYAGDEFVPAAAPGKNKTPDIFQGVRAAKGIVIDEQSPFWYELDEYNSVFDTKRQPKVSSRGKNGEFIGDTIIATNSISPLRFAKDLVNFTAGGKKYQDPANKHEINPNNNDAVNKYWQVRRRWTNLIVLTRDELNEDFVHAHVFGLRVGVKQEDGTVSNDNGTHVRIGSVKFKAVPEKEPEITDAAAAEIKAMLDAKVETVFSDDDVDIDKFLEDNGMVESLEDNVIRAFIAEVLERCAWDMLPKKFIYELYKQYRKNNYPTATLLDIDELVQQLRVQFAGWDYKDYPVKTRSKMDADEPLITEFGLDINKHGEPPKEWRSKNYHGKLDEKRRDFERSDSYRGCFVRK